MNNKGSSTITTPIVVAIGIVMVSVLILLAVNIITPFIWYEKLSSTCIKYVYLMEEYGYLTNKEAGLLMDELIDNGFDGRKIALRYTNNKVSYGEPIYLDINYDYEVKIPLMDSKIIRMDVNRSSVSKR